MLHAGAHRLRAVEDREIQDAESAYSMRLAQVEDCFEQRRHCHAEYGTARRELEASLSIKGRTAGEAIWPATSFAKVSELKRRCRQVDSACVEALIAFAHEVIARARGKS